mgnify:CR=1 FL=1
MQNILKPIIILFGKRTFQIGFSALFSLGPFFLLSLETILKPSAPKYIDKFFSYFDEGQISFLAISISGLVIWNGIFRHGNKLCQIMFVVLGILVTTASIYFIKAVEDPEVLHDTVSFYAWAIYFASLVFWLFALMGTDDPDRYSAIGESSNERVNGLLQKVD